MNRPDFAKYFLSFPSYLKEDGYADNSKAAYREAVIKVIHFMEDRKSINRADLRMKDLTREIIVECLDWILKNEECKANTRNYRLAGFKKFFEHAADENPDYTYVYQRIRSIKKIRTRNAERRPMTTDEITLLLSQPDLSTSKGRRDRVLLLLMYETAGRVQEIADLTPNCLRLNEAPTVVLEGKGKKWRPVWISPELADELRKYLSENGLDDIERGSQPLFSCGGKKLTRQAIYKRVKKYLVQAKEKNSLFDIEGLSCHTLRHSRATHWGEEGMSIFIISLLLGHSTEQATTIYAKVSEKQKREAIEKAHKDVRPNEQPKWKKGFDLVSVARRL